MKPVGPRSANVYWRRRVVVLVILGLVLALLIWGISAIVRGLSGGGQNTQPAAAPSPTSQPSESPSTSPSDSPSPTESTQAGGDCRDGAIEVVATADSRTHKVGEAAKLGLTIKNTSGQDCKLDVGSANITVEVTSGSDKIWSSDDCEKDSRNNVVDIGAGEIFESTVPWQTQRSEPGCKAGLPALRPGTYQVIGKVGQFTSSPQTLTLQAADAATN